MIDSYFNSATVCRLTHISQRQLNDWVRKDIVLPATPSSAGRGKILKFTFSDLVQIKTAAFLRHNGVSLQKVRKALAYIRNNFPDVSKPLAELKFLTDGENVFVITDNDNELLQAQKQLINASEYGQLVCIFKLGAAVKELESEVITLIHGDQKVVRVQGHEYVITITPDIEDGGYVSECPDLPGCLSQGETKPEAVLNIKSAIKDWLGEEKSQRLRA